MADIELLIKIDEEEYEFIKESITTYYDVKDYHALMYDICERIKNGTPLPKGHGELKDVNELKKIIKENDILTMTGFSVRLCDIDNTPTIIEADKGE